jgi:hypothetical protein
LLKPDIGLPVYRPDILVPTPDHRGTLLVSHTFDDQRFLPQLRAIGRGNGVKLTAMLQAALLIAVNDLSDPKPSSEELYKSFSVMDLRNAHLIPPYGKRNKYVNNAAILHTFYVPCNLLKNEGMSDNFWRATTFIGDLWTVVKAKKEMAKTAEADAKSFIKNHK